MRMPFALALLLLTSAGTSQEPFEVIVEPPLALVHVAEDGAIAQDCMTTLKEALDSYASKLPPGDEMIRVVLCHTSDEFARYAGPYAQPAVVGVALSEEGLIAVKAPRLLPPEADFLGSMRHELLHVLLARNIRLDRLPRWLNEGVTMRLSGEHRWASQWAVARQYTMGQLRDHDTLDADLEMPGREMEFGAAYAQSLSVTNYLERRLGEEAFWRLLFALNEKSFAEALYEEAGIFPDELFEEWQQSLWQVALISSIVSGFLVFQVAAFLVIWAVVRRRRRARAILAEWEAEGDDPGYLTWDEVAAEYADDEDEWYWDDDEE
jgi:hypothetical protein